MGMRDHREADGWHYDNSTHEFVQYKDNEVIMTVTEEAWTHYWKYRLHREGRWIVK